MAAGAPVTLHHAREVTLAEVRRVAAGAPATLAPETAALLDTRRREVVGRVTAGSLPAYGFNRGFGHNVAHAVADQPELLRALQRNLIRSHAAAAGDPAPAEVVRAAMFLRAASLSRGHSGVRSDVVRALLDALAADIVPVVPRHGSVSASGDLAPLSHVALALIGEGEVFHRGARRPAAAALADAGLAPLQLEMKEGLALNNGVQYITAIGVLAAGRLGDLLRTAAVSTALAVQALLGSEEPFRADLHALRPHPGAVAVAGWLRELLRGSPIREVHRNAALDGEVQDPYGLRCAAQVLGACVDLVRGAEATLAVEVNSVTDNPLILTGDHGTTDVIVSGGHFHGTPVAVRLHDLAQAAAICAQLAHTRCARLVDEARNRGLGADLIWPATPAAERATCSGLMALEYTSASLVNVIAGAAQPTHLWSFPTDAGQEDHTSMGAPLAVRLWETLPRLEEVLAVELAFCAQAAAIRAAQPAMPSRAALPPGAEALLPSLVAPLSRAVEDEEGRPVTLEVTVTKHYPWPPEARRLSPASEAALEAVRACFPTVTEDRPLAPDLARLAAAVGEGRVLAAARRHAALA